MAAAGNDGTNDPFYPAAFGWAVGVGSLDHDGDISSFSNYGSCADVYVVGRNHVNAFPHGTYVCVETPDKDDVRVFDRGLARWSGTSFVAPPLSPGLSPPLRRPDRQAPPQVVTLLAASPDRTDPWRSTEPVYGDYRCDQPQPCRSTPPHAIRLRRRAEKTAADPQTNRCENRSLWDTSTSNGNRSRGAW